MQTDELHYDLPPELIAEHPAEKRDASRLLVLNRASGQLGHETFANLDQLLPDRALLVMNDTKVLPARLMMRRRTGGKTEGLFLREMENGSWEIMLTGSARLKQGEALLIENSDHQLQLEQRVDAGLWHARPVPETETFELLQKAGQPPLPPYIRHARDTHEQQLDPEQTRAQDLERYQTIYARTPGAVAAPTAGLHFTPALIDRLKSKQIEIAYVTLHVGAGTFSPIRSRTLEAHEMHKEWYSCPAETIERIHAARDQGVPVVAVGTTTVRVLETVARTESSRQASQGWTSLFIYPPFEFRFVDQLITNFHLPGSSLLAMIYAFASKAQIRHAYQEAISQQYRFYSYGDAMLIQ